MKEIKKKPVKKEAAQKSANTLNKKMPRKMALKYSGK